MTGGGPGGSSEADPRERHDPDRHGVAAHIQWQKQDAWLVMWGPYTRRFWAFARWPVPLGGAVVSAPDPAGLYTEMREVERLHGFLRWRYGRRS
ncbi:hypothetical protein [Spinactinospora alkalitolerans]|nr:hypothetical protein [Spinactinospora alkalitolerans]